MVCKSCGYNIENDWEYCPNCATKINKEKKVKTWQILVFILAIYLLLTFAFCSFISFCFKDENDSKKEIYNNKFYDMESIKQTLENKYNESFTISFVSSIENPNIHHEGSGCPGYIEESEGTTEYYKLYSQKNDIEFFAYYSTIDETKKIKDNYKENLKRREQLEKTYTKVEQVLSDYTTKISVINNVSFGSLMYDVNKDDIIVEDIQSVTDLKNREGISKFNNQYVIQYIHIGSDMLYVYTNLSSLDMKNFIKKNHTKLQNLSEEIYKMHDEDNSNFIDVHVISNDNSIKLQLGNGEGSVWTPKYYNLNEFVEEK